MKRPQQHVNEDKSEDILKSHLPDNWIVRKLPKDYGVDYEIEIVDGEIVTGKRIWVQLKSQESTSVVNRKVDHFGEEETIPCISYSLETEYLKYVRSCPFPLLLFLTDLETQRVYWLSLQDEINFALSQRNPEWSKQEHNTLYLSLNNTLAKDREQDYEALSWYAMYPARMYLLTKINLNYHEYEEIVINKSFEHGENEIDEHEKLRLKEYLMVTLAHIQKVRSIDLLFGINGIEGLKSIYLPAFEESLRAGENAIQMLDTMSFSFTGLHMSFSEAFLGADKIRLIPYMFYEMGKRYLVMDLPGDYRFEF